MATTITKSIKSGGDYTTIVSWEANQQGDLVAADEIQKGELYSETYTDLTTIDGSTTDSTRYMLLSSNSAHRHDGTSGGGGAVIDPTSSGHVFMVSDDYFHAEWLRITGWVGSSSEAFRVNNTGLVIDKCIIHDSPIDNQDGVYAGSDNITINIRNTIFYDIKRGAVVNQTVSFGGVVLNIFNCTAYNCNDDADVTIKGQFSANSGTINVRNCASFDVVNSIDNDDFWKAAGASWGTSSHNISSDTSATTTGSNSINSKASTDQFVSVTGGSEDLHLKTGADCIDVGVDLSGTFTDDIDGITRSGTWDMGADELVAAAGADVRRHIIPAYRSMNL